MTQTNQFQQPIGDPVSDWTPRERPPHLPLQGRYCSLEPLDAVRHASELYAAYSRTEDGRDWTYMAAGPFADEASYRAHAERAASSTDPLHYAVVDPTRHAIGSLALMRIEPAHGVVEVGHVAFSPLLQGTVLSTEAQYLLMKQVFDALGYRRYEWKCDSLNAPSRRAALRLGFEFEGIFRQAIVYKGRSRDTAWFSITDKEWPLHRLAFEQWLAPENFDADGNQRLTLKAIRAAHTG